MNNVTMNHIETQYQGVFSIAIQIYILYQSLILTY